MRRFLPVLSVLVLAALCAPATAAERVGPPLSDSAAGASCPSLCLRANASGESVFVPADGILTKWRVRVESGTTGGDVQLRVLRPAVGAFALRALRSSAPRTITTSDQETVVETPARLPVREGDLLGVNLPSSVRLTELISSGGRTLFFDPPMDDTKGGEADDNFAGVLVALNADVEADRDGDGFGDETQDGCPADPSTQGACPAPPGTANPQPTTVAKHLNPPTLLAAGIKLDRRVRRITATFTCPANRASACTGTAEAVTAKAVRVRRGTKAKLLLGSKRYTAQPGQQARLRIRLTKGARALLRRSKRVRVAVRLQSSDARTTSARRTVRVPTSARPS